MGRGPVLLQRRVSDQHIADVAQVSGGVREYWVNTKIVTNLTVGPHDTDLVLPSRVLIYDILVDTTVAEVTGGNKTINIGIKDQSGDELASGVYVGSVQLQRPQATIAQQPNENFFQATTRGRSFAPGFLAGSNVAGDVGTNYEKPFNMDGLSMSRVVTISPLSSFSQFRGAIYLKIAEIVG